MDPMVSILIPVYNGADYMREAVESALAQTYSNIEIIVINDGSTDQTRDIALSYRDKIRYFEKDNGGVSTALNLGIKNMRGKYFSWLSHDDIYLPEKIQAQIDALRNAGDMSRIVYSNDYILNMADNKLTESKHRNPFRREFLETGAFAPLFGFISGCTLLIPKFYFDLYGGFDETFRAVQDYKKWFEMFRGKRLVYLDKSLVVSRRHAQQTTFKYSIRINEEKWLYAWMIYNLQKDDLVGSGLTNFYQVFSALFTRYFKTFLQPELNLVNQKMLELPESPDAADRAQALSDAINDGNLETFFIKEEENVLQTEFALRGITLNTNVKFIPANQFSQIQPAQNVRRLSRADLIQALIDAPVRKKNFIQWTHSGGQRP